MQVHWPPRNRTFEFVDILGCIGILGLLVARFVPLARLPFWGCAIRQTTGWPCPGCGLTRVAEWTAKGQLLDAWLLNPLATVAAVIFAGLGMLTLLHLIFRVPIPRIHLNDREAGWIRFLVVASFLINYGYMLVQAKLSMPSGGGVG